MSGLLAFIAKDLVGSLLLFPIWWYDEGFKGLLQWIHSELGFRWRSYAIALWLKNILVPMYGQYDWAGRLISFIVRLAVIIGRFIAFFVEILVYMLFAFMWVLAPAVFLLLFFYNLASSAF